MAYTLHDVAPVVIFAFGALTFSTLAAFYWGERRRRGRARRPTVFPAFTVVCAAAFLTNLLLQIPLAPIATSAATIAFILIRDLTAGLLPPLMLHVVVEIESRDLRGRRYWRWVLVTLYSGGIASTLSRGLNETGLFAPDWSDWVYQAPAALLAAASAAGLLVQIFSRRTLTAGERAHRRWTRAVLVLMLIAAVASLSGFGALVGQTPDYLLLVFLSVSLYYRERLVFFDLLVKRGVFVGVGLVILLVCLAAGSRFLFRSPTDWSPWIYAAGLLPLWLAAPWVYGGVARAIDRAWLRRPYSPAEAERQFIRGIQTATTEEELQSSAASSLSAIFQAPAEVRFDRAEAQDHSDVEEDSLAAELAQHGARLGSVRLAARPSGIPFLSDDRRLLESLAGTLGVVLENVRFRVDRRRQEEREQQLRWLASRAELKALRAQINPHFLFNALSVIAGLLHYQPELADETIEQLAQVFRYTLRKSENEWAPLAEEVDFVSAYLRIERARFGDRLQLEIAVDPVTARIPIPAMSIQPLVENAIRHGVSAVDGPAIVGLRTALDGDSLSIEVFDNGPGFPPDFSLEGSGEGHGLRNVAERLRGYHGDAAGLSWESGANGTRVILRLPHSAVSGSAEAAVPVQREEARNARIDCR